LFGGFYIKINIDIDIDIKKRLTQIWVISIVALFVRFMILLGPFNNTYGEKIVHLLIFPLISILYGWITKDKQGAIIVGAVPVIMLYFIGPFLFGTILLDRERFFSIFSYVVLLAIFGSLAGYFASYSNPLWVDYKR